MEIKGIPRKFFQLFAHMHRYLLDGFMSKDYFYVFATGMAFEEE